jgi:excisionase family DNA binding protein
MQKLITIREAAEALAVCPDTVRRLADRGLLKTVRVARRVLIPAAEIERVAAEGTDGRTKRTSLK